MRSLTLTGAAMLMAALLTGCGAESGPTAENTPGLTADATSHNTADHFSETVAVEEILVNPCNGELIQLSGTAVGQYTRVASREALDNGLSLHTEIHYRISQTGTGLTTGASYSHRATYHEVDNSPTPTAVNAAFGFRDAFRVTSPTPGLSFTVRNTFHLVRVPSGDFKVTKDSGITECRG